MTIVVVLAVAATVSPALALEEFDRSCSVLDTFEAVNDRIEDAGWNELEPEAGSGASSLITALGSFQSGVGKNVSFDFRYFESSHGNDMNLLVTQQIHGDQTVLECRLFAPSASGQPSQEELDAWAPREADRADGADMNNRWWEPGIYPTQTATGLAFVSPELAEEVPFLSPGLLITGRNTTGTI